jgi:hypothetical protein
MIKKNIQLSHSDKKFTKQKSVLSKSLEVLGQMVN